MELKMITGSKTVDASEKAFGTEFKEGLVHQAVISYLAGGRQGTKAQKNRSDVSGGGAKPWRQKGTGRARAGTSRSPIWRSGGVTFAARPRDFSQKINRKMYRRALASILSELVRQDRLKVVNKFEVAEPKTKLLVTALNKLKLENVLIILPAKDEKLILAARNLPNVDVCDVATINPVNLLAFENVLIHADAVKAIEEKVV